MRVAPSTGSYRAEVWPATGQWHATDPYDLHVQVASGTPAGTPTPTATRSPTPGLTLTPAPCGLDTWEPNDAFNTATFVWPGGLQGLICPSTDVDFFRFSANQYDWVTLDLDSLPADYNLRLWNPDGTLLEQSIHAGTMPEQIRIIVPSTGSYRAQVWPATGQWHATDPYDLRVQVTSTTLRVYLPIVVMNYRPGGQ